MYCANCDKWIAPYTRYWHLSGYNFCCEPCRDEYKPVVRFFQVTPEEVAK